MLRIVASCLLLCMVAGGNSVLWATINGSGQRAVMRTLTAKTLDKANMNFGVGAKYDQSGDYVKGPGGVGNVIDNANPAGPGINPESAKLLSVNPYLAFGMTSFWDVAVSLPGYYDMSGFGTSDAGIGDLEVSTKLLYLGMQQKRLFYQSYFMGVTVPVGMRNNGIFPRQPYFLQSQDINPAQYFYSSGYVTFKALMAWTLDIGNRNSRIPLQIDWNIGGVFSQAHANMRNTMIGALALQYNPADFLMIFVDFYGESRWSNFADGYKLNNDPVLCTPGFRVTIPSGVYLLFGADIALSSKSDAVRMNWNKDGYRYSTGVIPSYGVQFQLGWNGSLIRRETKPDTVVVEAALPKGFAVIDTITDSDHDSIPDYRDKCPRSSEDKDSFQDDDGCPDYDNDQDGIPDSLDKCPTLAEDPDGFEDADGCPDTDNDRDSIPDIKDKCPNNAEIYNGYIDEDGCPDTVPKKEPAIPTQQVLRGVAFIGQTADLSMASFIVLDALAKKLKEFPEVTIEVSAYTDGLGSKVTNVQISQLRAEAVRQYLISKGIDSGRIRAAGYGPACPIADNRTAAGRTANRRIEILRTK